MKTSFAGALGVILIVTIFLQAAPLRAQPAQASSHQEIDIEYYTPALTPGIWLVNFLFIYTANPDLAAFLPAYKAPIPQPVVDCLKQNPEGCPYAQFRQYFEDPARLRDGNRECFWSTNLCDLKPQYSHMAPRKFRQPEEINEPLGKARAEQLAHVLGITDDMILTANEYQCLIGTNGTRTTNQQIFVACLYNMTGSKGNALIPLSSYGLNVNDQGNIRSICASDTPCLMINPLLIGYLQETAIHCGFLEKLVRMQVQTPFLKIIGDAQACQASAGDACLVEAICAGKGAQKGK